MAGAMMWNGVSSASWMMYSPRSVSTGSIPSSSNRLLRPISSETMDLPLMAIFTPLDLARSTTYRAAASASWAK